MPYFTNTMKSKNIWEGLFKAHIDDYFFFAYPFFLTALGEY